jgi:hypothetical protein
MELLFGDNAAWYTVPAIIGTAFFSLRIVLMMIGMGADVDVDIDGADSTDAFHVLSLQSIAAFAMGFGWGGFAAYRGNPEWGQMGAVLSGLICGSGMVWLLMILLRAMTELQTDGNIPLSEAVGKVGEVYLTVPQPGAGRGQVKLVVDQRQRMYSAISGEEALPTGTRVRVVSANDDNTVTVARA